MSNPPFLNHCGAFLSGKIHNDQFSDDCSNHEIKDERDELLPLIDMKSLWAGGDLKERKDCAAKIIDASSEWGFFQVVNHGISRELFCEMRREVGKVFEMPFEKKVSCEPYRWGAPSATSLHQFSWSEAFHVPISMILDDQKGCQYDGEFNSLWEVTGRFATAMWKLAQFLAGILTENLGQSCRFLEQTCSKETCFLRLNRYPACPLSPEICGLIPHTDSDFLTILWQDQVGGLQLMKDSKWVTVRPNSEALIVNIGDLFQAWSNDVYRSVEHKVMTNSKLERYSIAFLLCPSYDSTIGTCKQPSIYKKFTFGEYRSQVIEDVKNSGNKVGLSRFLL